MGTVNRLFTPSLAVQIQALEPCTVSCGHVGGPDSRIWTALESAQKGSVAYQVAKLEMSTFCAPELSPGGMSQNHMDDFLKTLPTRSLTGSARHMRSLHDVTPRAQQPQVAQGHNLGCLNAW